MQPRIRMVIAASFTAEPIAEGLRFWAESLELPLELSFAPFGQLHQELLDAKSATRTNLGGINLLLARVADLDASGPERSWSVADAIATAGSDHSFLIGLCPEWVDGVATTPGQAENERAQLVSAMAALPNVHLLDLEQAAARYRVGEIFNPHGDQLGAIPYTREFFSAASTAVARTTSVLIHPPPKVVVLDCDGTLWDGVCGEDGPAGVQVGPARRALQEFLLARQREGMLLCLCSRNNEADVVATFTGRDDLALRLDDLVAWRVNWRPKSANLRALASELGLGLDSFVVLDDDPVVCAELRAACPEALVVRLPQEAACATAMLEHVWPFDRLAVTDEDRHRTAMYRQHREREALRSTVPTLEEYLELLELEVEVRPLRPAEYERAAQLTHRTNQFNLRPRRRAAAEIEALTRDPATGVWAVHVRDRYGDYGLVGLAVTVTEPPRFRLETFLLSCRVLGRHVEDTVLARLAELARRQGCPTLVLAASRTSHNAPALDFLAALAPDATLQEERAHAVVDIDALLDRARQTRYGYRIERPPEPPALASAPPPRRAQPPSTRSWARLGGRPDMVEEIALRYQTAQAVVDQLRTSRGSRQLDTELVRPRTATEAALTPIWADILDVDEVGVHDDFFALGGHSILAAQALSQVRAQLGVDVEIADMIGDSVTIAELARRIDTHPTATEPSDAEADLDDVLPAVEALEEHEVEALLAAEPTRGE